MRPTFDSSLLEPVIQPAPTRLQAQADALLLAPARSFGALFRAWDDSMRALWQGDTAALLQEIGPRAARLFELSAETALFLEKVRPGCTAETLTLRRPYTTHPDGTVTLLHAR